MKISCRISLLLFWLCLNASGQGFVNLNFEQAQIIPLAGSPYYPYGIAASNALPGWAVYYGSAQQSAITYNDPALGSTFVTLYATNGLQLAGNFSVLLQGGGTASAATIEQAAQVPTSAQSLLFYGAGNSFTNPVLVVSLNGQSLSFVAISSTTNYTVYGANVPAFAGQEATLAFSAPQIPGNDNNWLIDNIQFSSSSIPEPEFWSLLGLGSLFLARIRLRKRSRS